MYRLLATDIDDTILAEDGSLPEANHRALEDLHRKGITIVFSSGRATESMQRVVSHIVDLADDEFLISYNGAQVVRAQSGTPVFEWPLPADVIDEIIDYCRDHKLHLQGYLGGNVYTRGDGTNADRYGADYAKSTGMPLVLTADLSESVGDRTPKLLAIHDPATIEEHLKTLTGLSGGRYRVTRSKPHYIEFVHPDASKGAALTRLATELGIPIEETVAVGDSYNDIEMIEAAGLGIAVANAVDAVKAAADVVLDRTADDGAIAEIAERFFQ
jgi:Cof subfamily protein (haloacid dehalogenase superfamily)